MGIFAKVSRILANVYLFTILIEIFVLGFSYIGKKGLCSTLIF